MPRRREYLNIYLLYSSASWDCVWKSSGMVVMLRLRGNSFLTPDLTPKLLGFSARSLSPERIILWWLWLLWWLWCPDSRSRPDLEKFTVNILRHNIFKQYKIFFGDSKYFCSNLKRESSPDFLLSPVSGMVSSSEPGTSDCVMQQGTLWGRGHCHSAADNQIPHDPSISVIGKIGNGNIVPKR